MNDAFGSLIHNPGMKEESEYHTGSSSNHSYHKYCSYQVKAEMGRCLMGLGVYVFEIETLISLKSMLCSQPARPKDAMKMFTVSITCCTSGSVGQLSISCRGISLLSLLGICLIKLCKYALVSPSVRSWEGGVTSLKPTHRLFTSSW
jgi:hypothetical protein